MKDRFSMVQAERYEFFFFHLCRTWQHQPPSWMRSSCYSLTAELQTLHSHHMIILYDYLITYISTTKQESGHVHCDLNYSVWRQDVNLAVDSTRCSHMATAFDIYIYLHLCPGMTTIFPQCVMQRHLWTWIVVLHRYIFKDNLLSQYIDIIIKFW